MKPALALLAGLLVAASIGVIGWKIHDNAQRPTKTVVRPSPTTVLVAPPMTPLQARRAKRTGAAKSPDSTARGTALQRSTGSRPAATAPAAKRRASRPQTPRHAAPKTTPAAPGTPQQPPSPSDSTPTTPRPPADIQLPAPVTACLKDVGGLNCP